MNIYDWKNRELSRLIDMMQQCAQLPATARTAYANEIKQHAVNVQFYGGVLASRNTNSLDAITADIDGTASEINRLVTSDISDAIDDAFQRGVDAGREGWTPMP